MTNNPASITASNESFDELLTSLFDVSWQLREIIDHMARFAAAGHSAPDAAPIPDVLRGLLRGALAPMTERRRAADIEVAAGVVAEIADAIAEEIMLVAPDAPA